MSICATHLSRQPGDFHLWIGFLELPDRFRPARPSCRKTQSGSQQAGAPKARHIIGALTGLFIVMKGLPLAYSKDMQEDEGVFNALDSLSLCLAAMAGSDGKTDACARHTAPPGKDFPRRQFGRLAGAQSDVRSRCSSHYPCVVALEKKRLQFRS